MKKSFCRDSGSWRQEPQLRTGSQGKFMVRHQSTIVRWCVFLLFIIGSSSLVGQEKADPSTQGGNSSVEQADNNHRGVSRNKPAEASDLSKVDDHGLPKTDDHGLPKTIVRQLESVVIPALQAGDDVTFLESMGSIVQRAKPGQFDAIEEFGVDHGVDSLNVEFGRRVLASVEQGNSPNFSRMPFSSIAYVNNYLVNRIVEDLNQLNRHAVMQDEPALYDTWRENEKLFWEIHVYKNVMDNLHRLGDFAISINQKHFTRATRKNDESTLELLKPVGELPDKIANSHKRMLENEAVLRILELERAEQILREDKDFERRIMAAFAFELDTGHLEEFFKNADPKAIDNERLKDPSLGDHIRNLVKSGRAHGQDVITKAVQLRTGAHWWLRGRYGIGAMAHGLLKRPEAMQSPAQMVGLYMPKERPKPINSVTYENEVTQGYDRRHFYTWAVEYRELVSNSGTRVTQKVNAGPESASRISGTFW